MNKLPELTELQNESDVEQKLVFPILTGDGPLGLKHASKNILTKPDIRIFAGGKHRKRKELRPDYILSLRGIPMVVVEAKHPKDKLSVGLNDARMYANELNSVYPHGFNPVKLIFASNGKKLGLQYVDEESPFLEIDLKDVNPASEKFIKLINVISVDAIFERFQKLKLPSKASEATALFFNNRESAVEAEIVQNTFGERLNIDFRPLFTPDTPKERSHIARNAYIRSKRRDRYTEEIDKVIRHSSFGSLKDAKRFADSGDPSELFEVLRRGTALENQIILLIGGRGVGKTTFVDHLVDVAIPPAIKEKTVWVRLNLNVTAPDDEKVRERWVIKNVLSEIKKSLLGKDIYSEKFLKLIFESELKKYEGALNLIKNDEKRNDRLAEILIEKVADDLEYLRAICKFICVKQSKLPVIVLDNCDKRNKDDQLKMFEIARWLQAEISCLMIVPLRDVTYDRFNRVPPLDTTNKHYIFRIDPPPFSKVLKRRLQLVLDEIGNSTKQKTLSFKLQNGATVEFPRSELGEYLALVYRSLFDSDRNTRTILSGIAGNDIRKALEIFLEFCRSGHVGEDFYLKLRVLKDREKVTLPQIDMMNVLLRKDRLFYDEDSSFIPNLFRQTTESVPFRSFPRIFILQWLAERYRNRGRGTQRGFHSCQEIIDSLLYVGLTENEVWNELCFLVNRGAISSELQLTGEFMDKQGPILGEKNELVCISGMGLVLLRFLRYPQYLGACAESTEIDTESAKNIANRIVPAFGKQHLKLIVQLSNAFIFLQWVEQTGGQIAAYTGGLGEEAVGVTEKLKITLGESRMHLRRSAEQILYPPQWHENLKKGITVCGEIERSVNSGWLVKVFGGPTAGLFQVRQGSSLKLTDLKVGDIVEVSVVFVDTKAKRVGTRLLRKLEAK